MRKATAPAPRSARSPRCVELEAGDPVAEAGLQLDALVAQIDQQFARHPAPHSTAKAGMSAQQELAAYTF